MTILMNESLGAQEYDGLVYSASPADIAHAALATGYGLLKRGYLIARDSTGNLIPWGSDITADLVEVLVVTAHVATKSQAGLRTALLKVEAAEFYADTLDVADNAASAEIDGLDTDELVVKAKKAISETLTVTDHVATLEKAGLDTETLVVMSGEDTLELTTDHTIAYVDGVLTIALEAESDYYDATSLGITCTGAAADTLTITTHYTVDYEDGVLEIALVEGDYYSTAEVVVYCEFEDDIFVPIEKTADYTVAYAANTLTVTLVAQSDYYDTPKVRVTCPYAYSESTIAGGNLILAKEIDTGLVSGSTVVAEVYRTGIFAQNKLLYNSKALDGISGLTKEKLRDVGILLNDAEEIS